MKAMKCIFTLLVVTVTAAGCFGVDTPAVREKTEEVVVEGNNRFALELYAKLREQKGNLFFSPYSISAALAMTYAGARGETEAQMARVMHFPAGPKVLPKDYQGPIQQGWDQQRFHSAFGAIIKDLNAKGGKGKYELSVANALWGQKGYRFLAEFLELIEARYGGKLNEVDFLTATEAARQTINKWVEKETKDKIKELIKPGILDKFTRLVLTNAIYFKGNWARQFKEEDTKEAAFTLLSGEKVDSPMMNQTAEFGYIETENFQGLELPYVDDELSMIILLPKEANGLTGFEKSLTAENLSQWLAALHKRKVIVSVPKFKMTSEFSLADVLKQMGMEDAFSGKADFSGMTGKKDLYISAVIHKAFVDVNEEGTEAAAATAVVMRATAIRPEEIPVFRADHPFLFLIRDNGSGSILFIGRMMNPRT
jgi:serpin B